MTNNQSKFFLKKKQIENKKKCFSIKKNNKKVI